MTDRTASEQKDESKTRSAAANDDANTRQQDDAQHTSESDRPRRKDWTDEDHAEANRIAKKEAQKAVDAAKRQWEIDQEDKKQRESGEFEALLRKAEGTISETQTRLKLAEARNDVFAAAMRAGTGDPEAVWRLIKDDLEFSDDGKAANVDELLDTAKERHARLFDDTKVSAKGGDGGKRGTPPSETDMNAILRAALRGGSVQAN